MVIFRRSIFGLFSSKSKKLFQDPKVKYPLQLISKDIISHDTRKFRFALPTEDMVLGLPICQHVLISAMINDKLVTRPYTPISSDDDCGYVDIVIKIYFKNVHPKFPNGGKMTQYLECLNIGDCIDIQGPSGRIEYLGDGQFSIRKNKREPEVIIEADRVNLIAGGTGIVVALQLLKHIAKCPEDQTLCALLFANKTEEDIILREELEEVASANPDQLKLWYTLDEADECWEYSKGQINCEMLNLYLYPHSDHTPNFMCGPSPMIKEVCLPNLAKIGHRPDMCFKP